MKNKIIGVIFIVSILIGTLFMLVGCGKNKYSKITVYLKDGMSESEITGLENKIKAIKNVKSIKFTSKADALKEAKNKLGSEDENLFDHYTENTHPFPASFTLEIKKDKNYENTINEIKVLDGVKEVK